MKTNLYRCGQIWLACMILLAIAGETDLSLGVTHPHMIVKTSEYAALQARAQNWPWSAMKTKAIANVQNVYYQTTSPLGTTCSRAHVIASSCALAYILDPGNRSVYVNKVVNSLAPALDKIAREKGTHTDHGYNVPPAHAAFMAYLALDILYHDIPEDIRRAMEADCDFIADHHRTSWNSSEYGIKGMKELYHNGASQTFEAWKNKYRDNILHMTTEDGVYTTGPGYTVSRLFMDERMQKKIFMDICEYQGYHEFYSNPVFQNLYEYVMGYIITPFNRTYTFGDSPPAKELDEWAASALRVNRFSPKAQQYAAWYLGELGENSIEGGLLHFLLCDSIPLPAERPPSRIFTNGGAWFREASEDRQALAGALWNRNTKESGHPHRDVNAVHIAAYGEHILRNSGYDGYGEPDPATWEWIRNTAESSNTLIMNGKNHQSTMGGGITEGFTGQLFEYACGRSGAAIPIGSHERNFIFVHPREGLSHGYFLLIDEVSAPVWGNPENVTLFFHPNSAQDPESHAADTHYEWSIGGCNYSHHPVSASIFLATPPISTEIKSGYLASFSDCSRFTGKYLSSTYNFTGGNASVISVVFPSDAEHPPAVMDRLALNSASGAKIDHGNRVIDYALSSPDGKEVAFSRITLSGKAAVWREVKEKLESYLVRKGVRFIHGSSSQIGFKSGSEISIDVENKRGQIRSPGTPVTFYYPDLEGILLDGQAASQLDSGKGWLSIQVGEGLHSFEIQSDYTRFTEARGVQGFDSLDQNYPNPFCCALFSVF